MSNRKKVDYISASQIGQFLFCPIAYKFNYVDRIKRDEPNIYMSYGTVMHLALAFNNKHKIKTRKDLDIKTLCNYFNEQFEAECKPNNWTNCHTYTEMKMVAEFTLEKYLKEVAPHVMPMYVEQEFRIKLKHFPITIFGFIDVIMENWEVWDYKTAGKSTKKKWNQKAVDDNVQLTFYSALCRKNFKKAEKNLNIFVLPREPKPEFIKLTTHRTDEEVLHILDTADRIERIVELGVYMPNLNSCSKCPYNGMCNKQIIINNK